MPAGGHREQGRDREKAHALSPPRRRRCRDRDPSRTPRARKTAVRAPRMPEITARANSTRTLAAVGIFVIAAPPSRPTRRAGSPRRCPRFPAASTGGVEIADLPSDVCASGPCGPYFGLPVVATGSGSLQRPRSFSHDGVSVSAISATPSSTALEHPNRSLTSVTSDRRSRPLNGYARSALSRPLSSRPSTTTPHPLSTLLRGRSQSPSNPVLDT
jgi:hypothetical protein